MAPKPKSPLVDPTYLKSVVVGDRLKVEGYSFPLIYVKPESSFSFSGALQLMYFADRAARATGWQETLSNRFSKPVNLPKRQPHVIVSNRRAITQYWTPALGSEEL